MALPPFLFGVLLSTSSVGPLQAGAYNPTGNLFGFALAAVGDVDGDGVQDFLVGDPEPDGPPDPRARAPGRVWLVSTRTGQRILELCAGDPGDWFGQVVAGPGDLDGDCVPDFLVGSTPPDRGRSVVWAFSGANGSLLHTIEIDEFRQRDFKGRSSLVGLGDLDGDGCSDYAVASVAETGLVETTGEIRIISGRTGRDLLTLLRVELGGSPFRSLASAGDLDGDGYQDLIASREGGAAVEVWSPRKRERLLAIPLQGWPYRIPVSGGSDLDGDGTADVVAAVVNSRTDESRILAFSGKDGSLLRSWRARESWNFGEFVDLVDDLDGDSVPDLFVRSPDSSSQVSRVWILSGAEDRVLREWEDGPWMGSFFGVSGTAIGDVDRDGVPDFLIGEASWKAGASMPGSMHLYSGRSGAKLTSWGQDRFRDVRR